MAMAFTWEHVVCHISKEEDKRRALDSLPKLGDVNDILRLNEGTCEVVLRSVLQDSHLIKMIFREMKEIRNSSKLLSQQQQEQNCSEKKQMQELIQQMQEQNQQMQEQIQQMHEQNCSEKEEMQEQIQQMQEQIQQMLELEERPRKKTRKGNPIWLFYGCVLKIPYDKFMNLYELKEAIQNGEVIIGKKAIGVQFTLKESTLSLDSPIIAINTTMDAPLRIELEDASDILYEESNSRLCSFYDFNQSNPSSYETRIPNRSADVIYPQGGGAYKRMNKTVYFKLYYKTKRASDLAEFKTSADYGTFSLKKYRSKLPSPNIKFGSIVADEDLLHGNLKEKSSAEMKAILESAFVMPRSDIPELYINRSLKIQLTEYFDQYGFKVQSQQITFITKEEHNVYSTSNPDLVLWKQDKHSISAELSSPCPTPPPPVSLHVEVEGEESDGEESDDEDVDVACGELKKGSNGKFQLYGESFNVAVSYAAKMARKGKKLNEVSVYCWLLLNECRDGRISKMTVNFRNNACLIQEDPDSYSVDECVQILGELTKAVAV